MKAVKLINELETVDSYEREVWGKENKAHKRSYTLILWKKFLLKLLKKVNSTILISIN
ncbi:MAG: hypothetical protein ACP5H3_01435 [Candidatus Aenigmatarchaeota archaeon]